VPDANIKGRAMFRLAQLQEERLADLDRLFTHVAGLPKLPSGAPPDIVAGIAKC